MDGIARRDTESCATDASQSNNSNAEWKPSKGYRFTWAKVWCVEPERGDLYVVAPVGSTPQFVQVSEGIVDDTHSVMGRRMQVLCDSNGRVIALPSENSEWFIDCQPMQSPTLDAFL